MPKGVHLNPRVGWHLNRELVERLRSRAAAEGRTQVAVVTSAITEYLERHDTDERGEINESINNTDGENGENRR